MSRPDIMWEKIRKAKKQHECCECRESIRVDERYERITGVWDGEFSTFKTCMPCARLREYLLTESDLDAEEVYFGQLHETVEEARRCGLRLHPLMSLAMIGL